jgi:hypothetical protein
LNLRIFSVLAALPVSIWAQATGGGYAGPQILSRGISNPGERPGRPDGFQFYAGVSGSYETGLVPPSVDSNGKIVSPDSLVGVLLDLGAYGHHATKHTTIGLDYTGNFRHYADNPYFDGSDHMLGLTVETQESRRNSFFLRTAAGTVSRYYVGGNVSLADFIAVPAYGIVDNRAYYLQQTGGWVYQPTVRLSFSAAGNGFFVRRQSRSLVGLNGYGGQGTMAYRLSRVRTFDLSYGYVHFDYPRGFGDSDIHTTMAGLSQALNRRWELALAAGVAQISTIGLEQISADPLTVALFGNATTVQAFSRSILFPAIRASLIGRYRRSTFQLSYTQLPNPGNGVYLTSKQSTGEGSYSYLASRRASISFRAGYSNMRSIGQEGVGSLKYTTGGVGAAYKLTRALDATAQYEARDFQIGRDGFGQLSYRFTFGINWNPSEYPISFW